jgi:RNA polymerase sigma-70 factor (ECF subfamily)
VKEREHQWASWMEAAIAGDRVAYDRLLHALAAGLRPLVRRGLSRAGRDVSEAEDIVQDVLLAIHLKRHTWDRALPIGPWVHAIARHKLIDALRRRGGRYDLPIEIFSETLAAEDPAPSVSGRDMEKYLGMLPSGQSAVVRTIAIEGVSISETAVRLKMSQGAVRVALHRGLAALSKKLS